VHEGSILNVATLAADRGSRVELRDVLLVSDGDKVTVGSPNVADAVVVAEVLEHGKGRKVINFKFKAKTRYRRKRGHRQAFTRIAVREILTEGAKPQAEAPAPARRRARAATPAPEPAEAVATVEAPAPPPETPAPPARRRRRTATEAPDSQA
jgi:large subunit ribosomal protein L21